MKTKPVKKTRALLLMSGGLDSLLAARILMDQGVEVTPVCFKSYFFGCAKAEAAARDLGLKLRVSNFAKEQLDVVKNPEHGRGQAINPCIDCHLLMIKKAGEIMKKDGFDLVATGEVLEERPMSQNSRSIALIEEKSGLAGRLLRPLSAKLLPETEAEKKGQIDRSKLEAISGRSRKRQLELAENFGIKNIPQPSGGCILTEKDYGEKLKTLLEQKENIAQDDIDLLSSGRVFWRSLQSSGGAKKTLIVVARNESECENLKKLFRPKDFLFFPESFPGSTVLARHFGSLNEVTMNELKSLGKKYVIDYSKKAPPDARIISQSF
jgi:tRNA U34 2-thiouridine synthase MnmA/TrmU